MAATNIETSERNAKREWTISRDQDGREIVDVDEIRNGYSCDLPSPPCSPELNPLMNANVNDFIPAQQEDASQVFSEEDDVKSDFDTTDALSSSQSGQDDGPVSEHEDPVTGMRIVYVNSDQQALAAWRDVAPTRMAMGNGVIFINRNDLKRRLRPSPAFEERHPGQDPLDCDDQPAAPTQDGNQAAPELRGHLRAYWNPTTPPMPCGDATDPIVIDDDEPLPTAVTPQAGLADEGEDSSGEPEESESAEHEDATISDDKHGGTKPVAQLKKVAAITITHEGGADCGLLIVELPAEVCDCYEDLIGELEVHDRPTDMVVQAMIYKPTHENWREWEGNYLEPEDWEYMAALLGEDDFVKHIVKQRPTILYYSYILSISEQRQKLRKYHDRINRFVPVYSWV